ncbi:MAG: SAM-dependent methyltransferase [Rhodospirillales bacterium]|nr:SAM-dependent methyltransferase [Rhodospirillales bacterium]
MTDQSHETVVAGQFGPRAANYVTSLVHAQGADLDQLATLVDGRREARVLDLGCGGGHVSFRVAPLVAEVVAYDLSPDMLDEVARQAAARGLANIATRQGNVETLPFADASFDIVLSRYSAHHWRNLDAALREARRVLKPGGFAAFADAASPGPALLDTHLQGLELLRDPSHVRDYSVTEWRQALTRAGFAPGPATERCVRLDFASWVARIGTPTAHVAAIRSLQKGMSRDVAAHFAVEADGSFMLDTMTITATPA